MVTPKDKHDVEELLKARVKRLREEAKVLEGIGQVIHRGEVPEYAFDGVKEYVRISNEADDKVAKTVKLPLTKR